MHFVLLMFHGMCRVDDGKMSFTEFWDLLNRNCDWTLMFMQPSPSYHCADRLQTGIRCGVSAFIGCYCYQV